MPAATTTNLGNSFAILLRKFRKRAGLSQQQLADYLVVSPKRISKWETGVSDPPEDPTFYESLRNVRGFTESDIALLLEAREGNESVTGVRKRRAVIEADEALLDDSVNTLCSEFAQKLAEAIEKSLKIRATEAKFGKPGTTGIEVRKEGILRRGDPKDRKRAEALKANWDRGYLTADNLKILGGLAAKGQQYVIDVIAHLKEATADLPEELQPMGKQLTEASMEIITASYAETLTRMSAAGLAESVWAPTQATATLPAVKEAEEPSAECLPDTGDSGIISPPMPHEVVEHGDHLTKHIRDLQSQATLGSETNQQDEQAKAVKQHVEQLREEGRIPQGVIIYQRGSLPGKYEHHAKQLVEALGNQQHSLRKPAERSLRGFAVAAEKERGISASSAAREFNAPTKFFIRWAKQFGIIPILDEGKGQGSAMILDRVKAQEAADIYHKAKQQGVQPKKYLERMSQR